MSTTDTIHPTDAVDASVPEQLSLLAGSVPLQFRLDERTRRSGLQHIAELRQVMAAQAAARRSQTKQAFRRHGEGDAGKNTQIAA